MSEKEMCEIFCYNEEKVNYVQEELADLDMTGIVQLLKALADERRTKIILSLSLTDELCVCDIANILDVPVANTSHHLRTLLNQGLVTYRKEGKLSFYRLANERVKDLMNLVADYREEIAVNG